MVPSDDIDSFLNAPESVGRSTSVPVSSESSSSPSASPSSSSTPLDPSDPDFVVSERKKPKKTNECTITLNNEKWIRDLNLQARRGIASNADIFRFCAATIQSGGGDLAEFSLSEEWIRLARTAHDIETANIIKGNFIFPVFLEIHFDGKIRKQWGQKNNFLALCVTGKGMEKEKVLGDIPIARGTGKNMASAVLQMLNDWGVADRVIALCFDTTSSNTGTNQGANVFIEQGLGVQLLWCACFHHILDILAELAVEVKLGPSSGPREKYFARFESNFNSLTEEEKETIRVDAPNHIGIVAAEDGITRQFLDATRSFFSQFMAEARPFQRGDYLEFARLIMFLTGMTPELKWSERVGAIHHARWMGAAIYILKMVICGEDRVQMGQKQAKGLLDLAYFILCIFGRYWFAAPVAADAPFLTLTLWNDLRAWASHDPALSAALLRALDRHTWYLSGRSIVLALFSKLVDDASKGRIASALLKPENEPGDVPPGKPGLPPITPDSVLEDFVNSESWLLFQMVKVQPTFLGLPVDQWENDTSFLQLRNIVTSLRVVNDAAERAVKFGADFTQVMTKDEGNRQNILQSVELARRAFPHATRKCFLSTSAASSVEQLMEIARYDARHDGTS